MSLPRFQSLTQTAGSAAAVDDAPALHVVTFGCQMNKYDSLLVEGRFRKEGYRVTESMGDADVVLFNTCSVREHAEARVYSWLGELKHARATRPDLVIGVMGCMAQRAEEEIFQRAAHVDVVCGTRQLHNLPALVDELRERRAAGLAPKAARVLDTGMGAEVAVERAGEPYTGGIAGYLAVMRGCDLNCTFCIVPKTRGRVQSRPIPDLVREAQWMVEGGARVLTLLGQTVNSYGEDLAKDDTGRWRGRQGRPSLADLLYALEDVRGLERVRLITLHPSYVTEALAEALRDCSKTDAFVPLPVQSGSDDVLRRMKRGYTTDLYRRRIDLLREAVPTIELGTDWIVGFPGETDGDFDASERFLEEIGHVQSYVFKYDPRPETRSFSMTDDVPVAVKKERNQRLLWTAERVALARHERWIGETVEVFVESVSPKRPDTCRGLSRHGIPVSVRGSTADVGQSLRVSIGEASPFGLSGARVETGA
ncbi:MAG: tRNA (N6-isopentenyl adenosine(37)-C2)-methylthiotransferase MiaB [Planctomycetota bacterium]